MVGTTVSKRFWDTGVLKVIKGEEICKDKGTGLGVEGNSILQLVVFRPLLSEEAIKENSIYAAICMCKAVYW